MRPSTPTRISSVSAMAGDEAGPPGGRVRSRRSRSRPMPALDARSTPGSGRAPRASAPRSLAGHALAHGVRAIEDPMLVHELAERGTCSSLPDQQRRVRRVPVVRRASPAELRAAGVQGHARYRRPALLRRHARRRVRRLCRAYGLGRRRPPRASPRPRSTPRSATTSARRVAPTNLDQAVLRQVAGDRPLAVRRPRSERSNPPRTCSPRPDPRG